MIELLADANGDLTAARFLVHPSDMTGLLKQQVTSGGGDTTLSFVGNGYRIAVRHHRSKRRQGAFGRHERHHAAVLWPASTDR